MALGFVAAASGFLTANVPAAPPAWVARPWPRDKPLPPLELNDLDGTAWRLSALRGRPVMLNFWATWCEPCQAEMPSLQALAKRHADAGLVVLAINYQDSEAKIRDFLARVPVALPVLLDRDGAAAKAWTPRVFPSTVLIDRRGQALVTLLGEVDWTGPEAAAQIAPLLANR